MLRSLFAACLAWGFSSAVDAAQIQAQAVPGRPFGFGIVRTVIGPADEEVVRANAISLVEADDRVLYTAVSHSRPGRLGLLRRDRTPNQREMSIFFLFRDDQPLNVTLHTSIDTQFTISPTPTRLAEATRLWNLWWREYIASAQQQMEVGDYPPLMETYLPAMLSNRLGLPFPVPSPASAETDLQTIVELIAGSERLRITALREILGERDAAWPAPNLPLPQSISWSPPSALPLAANVEVEPIARHVPENCFYVRFGNFGNFMWLDRLTQEYGGDLARMARLRGHRIDVSQRIQRQFGLEHSALAALLADQFVADLALIGRDAYLSDGAAIGVLIQAKNGLISFGIHQQRSAAAEREKQNGGKVESVKISGVDATYLSTPDGRLRSYYLSDGDFHLVTTSRSIAEGFVQAGKGSRSLADNWEFRHARSLIAASRGDTLFAFMSPAFFRELLEPSYQIEVLRRRRSVAEIELVQLAALAGRRESIRDLEIPQLIQAGLLPAGFGQRTDGSALELHDRKGMDSVRGARGFFLPIPDVTVEGVSALEVRHFAQKASFFQSRWREMDPLAIAIRRFTMMETNRERLVVEAIVSPLVEEKYGRILTMIGEPVAERIRPLPEDVIWIEAAVDGRHFDSTVGPHHLFFGIRDLSPLADLPTNGLLQKLRVLATTPAYFGAWPQPGLLDRLPLGLGGKPDAHGYARLPLGLWRRQVNGLSVLSFDTRILNDVTNRLVPERTDNAAQVRVHVSNLAETKLAQTINAETYQRALDASVGNAKFLHALTEQFGIPRELALKEAEQLLNVQLVCPLNGQYQLVSTGSSLSRWSSTKWPNWNANGPPVDYQAPVLGWFRGLEGEVTKTGNRITAQIQIDMERHPAEANTQLPLFNLFGAGENGAQTKSASEGEKPRDGKIEKKRIREF